MTKLDIDKSASTHRSGKLYFMRAGVLVVCLSFFNLNCVNIVDAVHKNMTVKGDLSELLIYTALDKCHNVLNN